MILSTDGQTDKVIPVYPPINFVEAEGIIMGHVTQHQLQGQRLQYSVVYMAENTEPFKWKISIWRCRIISNENLIVEIQQSKVILSDGLV